MLLSGCLFVQEPSGSSDQPFPVSVQFGVSQTYVCSVLCKHGQNRIVRRDIEKVYCMQQPD